MVRGTALGRMDACSLCPPCFCDICRQSIRRVPTSTWRPFFVFARLNGQEQPTLLPYTRAADRISRRHSGIEHAHGQGRAHRKPLLLFSLSGLFLLRFDPRRLFVLLLNDPPRNTRMRLGIPT